ncbi:hypothetical protein LH425_06440 [Laribacter hongkongensis]|uniref:hypothetical protein n=1 Tax=Laribacter hongkongensis TaxID=168471 RepID=UPI001EFDC1F3|nr:hypothetical protein [Laribacter hongkongensis]MCG9064681.1 hypothetical protein [Laribacter hongkongensis]
MCEIFHTWLGFTWVTGQPGGLYVLCISIREPAFLGAVIAAIASLNLCLAMDHGSHIYDKIILGKPDIGNFSSNMYMFKLGRNKMQISTSSLTSSSEIFLSQKLKVKDKTAAEFPSLSNFTDANTSKEILRIYGGEKKGNFDLAASLYFNTLKTPSSNDKEGGVDDRFRELLVNAANSDPQFAKDYTEQFAYDESFETTGPLVDISGWPVVRYSYTGEIVTDQNMSQFKSKAAEVRAELSSIYQAEKSNGVSDIEIMKKLFQYMDTLPDAYLRILGWEKSQQA